MTVAGLTETQAQLIKKIVERIVREYGGVLERLGKLDELTDTAKEGES